MLQSYHIAPSWSALAIYSKEESSVLIGYSDADWGGDCNDYKSTSG